jgi:hypothetical protein
VSSADTIDLRTSNISAASITPAANQICSVRAVNP